MLIILLTTISDNLDLQVTKFLNQKQNKPFLIKNRINLLYILRTYKSLSLRFEKKLITTPKIITLQ